MVGRMNCPTRSFAAALRSRCAVFGITLLLISSAGGSAVASAADASAAPGPSPAAFYCPLEIRAVKQLSSSEAGVLVAYALGSLDEEGQASGTLAFYYGNDRYEAPFKGVKAVGFLEAGDAGTPIVVRFPPGVLPDAAYVSKLGGDECPPGFVWLPSVPHGLGKSRPYDADKFESEARGVVPIAAQFVSREGLPSCNEPTKAARVVSPALPDYPDVAAYRGITGNVDVAVIVLGAGAPQSASVFASSGNAWLDRAAVVAAEKSNFSPGRFRSRDVSGVYLFHAEFRRGP
jgi:TonB family protein